MMTSTARAIRLQEISFKQPEGYQWRPVQVRSDKVKWVWNKPADRPNIDLILTEGKTVLLEVKVKRLRLIWVNVVSLVVTQHVGDQALASGTRTHAYRADKGYVGTVILHFSEVKERPEQPQRISQRSIHSPAFRTLTPQSPTEHSATEAQLNHLVHEGAAMPVDPSTGPNGQHSMFGEHPNHSADGRVSLAEKTEPLSVQQLELDVLRGETHTMDHRLRVMSLPAKPDELSRSSLAQLGSSIPSNNYRHSVAGMSTYVRPGFSENAERDFGVVAESLEKARDIVGDTRLPIDRLRRVQDYLDLLLGFGSVLSELDPVANIIMTSVTEIINIFQSQKKVQEETFQLLEVMSRALPLLIDVDKFETADNLKKAMIRIKETMVQAVNFAVKWARMQARHSITRGILRTLSDKDRSAVEELKKAFAMFIAEYDREVSIETLIKVQDTSQGLHALYLRTQEQEDRKTLGQIRNAYAYTSVMSGDADGCLEGTRENVLNEIMAWVSTTEFPNILWLRSMPGAGKSAIARTIVRRLKACKRNGPSFFFSRDDIERLTPFALWCHVLYTLSSRFDAFRREALTRIRQDHFEIGSSQAEDVFEILIQTLASLKDGDIPMDQFPVIVIDALDECPQFSSRIARPRQSVLTAISRWSKISPSFKIIVTSREDSDIEHVLGNGLSYSLHLSTGVDVDESSSRDIQHFMRQQLSGYSDLSEPSDQDLEILSRRAAGLFIWAVTAVRFVLEQSGLPRQRFQRLLKDESVDQRLDELSKLYHILLTEQFTLKPDDSISLAFQCVVGTIVVAATPLTTEELVGLLINSQDPPLDKSMIEHILKRIEMVTSARTVAAPTIRFSHQSFPQFLLEPRSRSQFYAIDLAQSKSYMALRCLDIMNTSLTFNIGGLSTYYQDNSKRRSGSLVPSYPRATPSLCYVVLSFSAHLVHNPPSSDLLAALLIFFEKHLLHWLELMSYLTAIHTTTAALEIILRWLSELDTKHKPSEHLVNIVSDALIFTSYFSQCMGHSALHAYFSSLLFSPTSSYVAKHYKKDLLVPAIILPHGQLSQWPCLESGDEKPWAPVTKPVFGMLLTESRNYVYSAVFTPDGNHVVTGSGDRAIRVWSLATGQVVRGPYTGHTARITSVAVSTDGIYIASASEDQSILVRIFDTGVLVGSPLTGHSGFIMSIAFSYDGARIVSASADKTLRIWDVASGRLVFNPLHDHRKTITSVAISRDGKFVVSGSNDKSLCLWNLETGQLFKKLLGHTAVILSVAFSPDGTHVASGSGDNTVRIWTTDSGEAEQVLEGHSGAVTSVAFSQDGTRIVSGSSDNQVNIWNVEKKTAVTEHILKGHTDTVYTVACSADGQHIISGSRDQSLRLWNISGHSDKVTAITYSGNGSHIASGSCDGSVRVWNVESKDTVLQLVADYIVGVTSLAFSSDGSRIVSGYQDNSIRVWRVDDGELIATRLPTIDHTHARNTSVSFSADSQTVLFGSTDNILCSWSIAEPKEQASIQLYTSVDNTPSVMAFSLTGQQVVVKSSDHKSLQLYSTVTGEPTRDPLVGHYANITSLSFSRDAKYIVSGSEDQTVRVWNAETRELVCKPLVCESVVTSVAFSSDGKRVSSGSADGVIFIWDAESGNKISGPLEGHLQPVTSVAFSPDGLQLASGSEDHAVRIWSLLNLTEREEWILSEDGWATGPQGEVLFYVPPIHRPNLYRPRNTHVFAEYTTQVDLDRFREWADAIVAEQT